MVSNFISKQLHVLIPIVLGFAALQCEFPSAPMQEFVQQSVSPVTIKVSIVRQVGSSIVGTPRLALNYLVYYQNPDTQYSITVATLNNFPSVDTFMTDSILPPSLLNLGFALGYGNYVLGAAEIMVYDDANNNGIFDPGETILGCSPDFMLIYLQGSPTQDLERQFGALAQGYNLCESYGELNGVDEFLTTAPSDTTIPILLPKDPSIVQHPVVR